MFLGNFGDCCSDNCDSFALGKNAEEYDWSAYGIPVTTWIAGSVVEVQWYVGANHAGIHTLALGHRRMAYTAFWTKAPPGRKNNMPKGTVMVKKPILSIHIELNIIYPFPNNKY